MRMDSLNSSKKAGGFAGILLWFTASAPAEQAAPAGENKPEPGIKDNSFFIEEAYNQEAGVVQHILAGSWLRSVQWGERADSYDLAFTQEWPFPFFPRHQFSYTIPFQWLRGDVPHAEGLSDVLLNYRYQVLEEDEGMPAFAPRFSLVLPSGSEDRGLGRGEVMLASRSPCRGEEIEKRKKFFLL